MTSKQTVNEMYYVIINLQEIQQTEDIAKKSLTV